MKNFQPNPSIFFVMIKLGEGVGVDFFVDIDAVEDLYYIYNYIITFAYTKHYFPLACVHYAHCVLIGTINRNVEL